MAEVTMQRVGVVGAGIMGTGIAEVCARSGADVVLTDIDEQRVSAAYERVSGSLARASERGKLDPAERDATLARVRATTDVAQVSDRQLVIEAIVEDEHQKTRLFAELDELVADPQAILASNTSSIPIMRLAMATSRRERVVGLHFFNPVPVMRLVEIVPSLVTSSEVAQAGREFVTTQLGKVVIDCPDRAGFVVNALLVPYMLSAVRMLESGFASLEDIDTGMREGCRHPMGPLELADLVGLDTTLAVAQTLYEEFKEPLFAPPPLLSRMVDGGMLGRKSGQGFYPY